MPFQKPIDNGFNQLSTSFVFREVGGITIPKGVRERAFSLDISVEIVSFLSPYGLNFRSYPAKSFFGYAVLVFYDNTRLAVPIEFGRQNLFQERNDSAYSLWDSFKSANFLHWVSNLVSNDVGRLAIALGFTVSDRECDAILWKGFPETPLREVYIKFPFGTVFRIHSNWEVAVPFQNVCGSIIFPKSEKVDDPVRDKGLPPSGILPNKPPSSVDPYGDFPLPSSSQALGEWRLPKLPSDLNNNDGLDVPNSNNAPAIPPPGTIYWLKCAAIARRPQFPNGCAGVRTSTQYIQLLNRDITYETRPRPLTLPISTGCGNTTTVAIQIRLTGGEWFDLDNQDSDSPIQITRESGLVLPAYSLVFS